MSWEDDYQKFHAFFNQFERDLHKKSLSEKDEKSLMDNLNQVVEWGWKTLQNYNTNIKSGEENPHADGDDFSGNHALLRLKEMFEKNIQVKSMHDIQFLK